MRWSILLSLSAAVTLAAGCAINRPATTAPPTTLATSTSTTTMTPTSTTTTTSTSATSVCTPAAPTVSCIAYPGCPKFTTSLSDACPSKIDQCKDNYFLRCRYQPAAGSQPIISFTDVTDADVCRQECDKRDSCSAISFDKAAKSCALWKYVNGTIQKDGGMTLLRICKDTCAGQPVKRGEDEKGDKSVKIAKWTQGKHRGSKDKESKDKGSKNT